MEEVTTYEYLLELYNCIKRDKIEEYKHKEWLLDTLDYLLYYDERPDTLRVMLYDVMQDLFPYKGYIYHGFISYDTVDEVVKNFRNIVSYTYSLDEAYLFATGTDHMNTNAIVMGHTDKGFNFYKFMVYLSKRLEGVSEIFEGYEHEREILSYPVVDKVVDNCLEKNLSDIKMELGISGN